ncbi:MAG: hypothetical protein RR293_04630 [Bacteroidales bacterium]
MKKFALISVLAIIIGLGIFCYFRFYFVFGEGVKSGTLNFVVYKGVLFKTYEGKIIQSGLKGGIKTGGIQSYEFDFSVENKQLAEKLMLLSGQNVELHYKEYFGSLPWRGYTKFIVSEIISINGKAENGVLLNKIE